jgi:hypothetical protein
VDFVLLLVLAAPFVLLGGLIAVLIVVIGNQTGRQK